MMKKNFWDQNAKIYNLFISMDHKAYIKIYELLKDVVKNKKVLELACGTGMIAKNIADNAKCIEAVDSSLEMIKKAKENNRFKNLYFSRQDMFNLPYKDKTFDVIIIANALHIVSFPEKALKEIRRVLKDDGIMVAPTFMHGEDSFFEKFKLFIMRLRGFPIYNVWTYKEYIAFLKDNEWLINKQIALKGSFPLLYVECTKSKK